MKTKPLVLLLSALLALIPACSKKPIDITGQIFVVTRGGEYIKMGGLEVRVIPDDEFQAMAKATVPWMQEEAHKEAQQKIDYDHMRDFIMEVMAMEESAANPMPELPQIRKNLAEEYVMAEKIRLSVTSAGFLPRGIAKLMSGATSTVTVTTDADGRFTVPITGKTWFLAVGQRDVGGETENYNWVKSYEAPEGAKKPTLAISNDADIDTEDALYSVLSAATGASGELEEFCKVEVSEKMKALVARHREAVNTAKVKAEREAAETKVKLTSEVQAKQIGAVANVPLAGNAVMAFAYCPAGSFTMGSPSSENGHLSDENQVRVSLTKGFWLAKTEVTQALWQAVMEGNPSNFKGDNLPVEQVSWNDAQEFIEKVNASGVIPAGWKMALPTEAQWEYACRSGETGPYAGGFPDEVAWHDDNSGDKTHEVGTKKPNAWELHDMHGNVWELCADWYGDELPGGTDPTGTSSGDYRVVRGGSWDRSAAACRAAYRGGYFPDSRNYSLGFRPALVPSE